MRLRCSWWYAAFCLLLLIESLFACSGCKLLAESHKNCIYGSTGTAIFETCVETIAHWLRKGSHEVRLQAPMALARDFHIPSDFHRNVLIVFHHAVMLLCTRCCEKIDQQFELLALP